MAGLSERVDKALLNIPCFPLLDFLVFNEWLVIPWELLGCVVDEDEDYKKHRIGEGFEFVNDHHL